MNAPLSILADLLRRQTSGVYPATGAPNEFKDMLAQLSKDYRMVTQR
jgi:hypothetical protein